MASAISDRDRQNIIDFYQAGMGPNEICNKLGIGKTSVYRILRRNGVKARGKRIDMPSGVVEAFNNGESVYSIAKRLGVSRQTVTRWLTESGVKLRGCSDAGLVRASKMTPEQRAAQAEAAHRATLGRTATVDERVKRSITVERLANDGTRFPSKGESIMRDWLVARGFECTLQKSEWIYNLDIAIGERFAVEILGGAWHAIKSRRIKESARLENLLNRGWSIVYVWNTTAMPIEEVCADEIVRLYDFACANPSPCGQYWVIRGDGKLTIGPSDDVNERTFILPSHARQ
jgi:transposase